MSWEKGTQNRRPKERDINEIISQMDGFIEEKDAKLLLYELESIYFLFNIWL